MHTSGKVAAWLVAISVLIAAYFSVRTFRVRDKWMELAQKNKAEIKKNEEDIAKLTRTMEEKRMTLARTMIGWDREWSGVPCSGNLATVIEFASWHVPWSAAEPGALRIRFQCRRDRVNVPGRF